MTRSRANLAPKRRRPAPANGGRQTGQRYPDGSRVTLAYDAASMERFFWSRKNEWTNHVPFADLESARLSLFKYIETFYNPVRLHQTLGYRSPDQYEADLAPATAAYKIPPPVFESPGLSQSRSARNNVF